MKKLQKASAFLIVVCCFLALFAGCTTGDAVKYHIKEEIKKYAEPDAEAEQAILAFAEKYGDFQEMLQKNEEIDDWAKLSIEAYETFTELDETYLQLLIEKMEKKIEEAYKTEVLSKDEWAAYKLHLMDYYSLKTGSLGLDCINYQYGVDTSERMVEQMAREAGELTLGFLRVFTEEGDGQ